MVTSNKLLVSFVALTINFLSFNSFAQTQFTGITSLGLGGTGRAAVRAEEVGFLNPASLMHVRGYMVGGSYRDMNVRNEGSVENVMAYLSESGTKSMFPLNITYLKTRNYHLPFVDKNEEFIFSTATRILNNLSLGLNVSRSEHETSINKEADWNTSIGLMYVLNPDFAIGLVYYNLLDSDTYYLARRIGFGSSYLFKGFLRFFMDLEYMVDHNPDNELQYMLGLEHILTDMLAYRMGLRFDDMRNSNYWTLGIGFNGPRLALGYAFEKNFSYASEYSHSVDLKLTF